MTVIRSHPPLLLLFALAVVGALVAVVTVGLVTAQPDVPHTLEGRDQCTMCHVVGGGDPITPDPPANHEGYGDSMCLGCHQAAVAETPMPPPTAEPTATPEPTEEPTGTPEPTEEPTGTPEPPISPPTGTPEPGGQPVVGWTGHVVSLPAGAQFDDYLSLEPEGAGEIGLTGANPEIEAEIEGLRDKEEPGKYAHFWGTLTCDMPDYGGCRLVVTRLRLMVGPGGPFFDPDPVEGWEGIIVSYPPGSQFKHYFALAGDFPVGYGIDSHDPTLAAQLKSLGDTQATIRVWGELVVPALDAYGTEIVVTRIEVEGAIPVAPPHTGGPPSGGDDGSPVLHLLLALGGLAVLAGAGGLSWRLRRQKA